MQITTKQQVASGMFGLKAISKPELESLKLWNSLETRLDPQRLKTNKSKY